jgi:predicted GIY-YIG superfamily endonuclease
VKPIIIGQDTVGNISIIGNEGNWDGREVMLMPHKASYQIIATDRVKHVEVFANFPSYRHASEALSCVRDQVETLQEMRLVLGECEQAAWGEVQMDSMVYILHFDRPYYHARHYLGSTSNLRRRVSEHKSGHGSGAALTDAIRRAGIGFVVADVWPGNQNQEYQLKNHYKNTPKLCPICKERERENHYE